MPACPSCGHENSERARFCEECGSPIAHDPDAAPPIIALKGGSLDSEIKKTLKPVCFSFSSSLLVGEMEGALLANEKWGKQDTEIWTVGKLPFCQEHLEKPFTHMPPSE